MKEAASVTWRAVRQWRRGWGTFCDKRIAVKSERAEGVSVGDPLWSSSPVAPLPLESGTVTHSDHTDLYRLFQTVAAANTATQLWITRQPSVTGRSALFSCWETRLTVGPTPTLQTASSLHSFLLETFSGASNAAWDLRPAVNKMSKVFLM